MIMNERNILVYKNTSLILFSKRVHSLLLIKGYMERDILRERTSSHISFREPGGANAYTHLQTETPLIGCMSLARLRFCALGPNLTTWWESRGLLPVTHLLYPTALIALPCLLITTWQLVKAHGVTRNESIIHSICYITVVIILCGRLNCSI